jgi:hypothetical protein
MQWVPGALSSWIKRPGGEDGQSPSSSAKVKNGGTMLPLPHMPSRRGAQLIKRRYNFTPRTVTTGGHAHHTVGMLQGLTAFHRSGSSLFRSHLVRDLLLVRIEQLAFDLSLPNAFKTIKQLSVIVYASSRCIGVLFSKTKLRGLSLRANYADRATAACQGATWSA